MVAIDRKSDTQTEYCAFSATFCRRIAVGECALDGISHPLGKTSTTCPIKVVCGHSSIGEQMFSCPYSGDMGNSVQITTDHGLARCDLCGSTQITHTPGGKIEKGLKG
ncbi:hypothetical protein LIA77_03385 [Sarocladium implicatum]|nr:hypothetical protein LIA77_03385 [Sarocladium implicatum]